MSCPHGNHPDACDICDEVDAAYESGKKDAIAELAGVEMPEPVAPVPRRLWRGKKKRLQWCSINMSLKKKK